MRKIAIPLLATLVILSACQTKAPDSLPPLAEGTDTGIDRVPPPSGPGYTPGSQGDFLANTAGDRIFFDTDRFNIDNQDQAVLQSQAQWLARYPQARATIEGHADERGTRDYNLALGERRANAAKNYLASLGVNPARLTTVSYGKERPDALGSNEDAWARNRRAVTLVVQ